ncbi:MAG: hypothetical protein ACREQ4_04095, partial [Candidatus Binataceae bacterium]
RESYRRPILSATFLGLSEPLELRAPLLGEYNEEILTNYLGYTADEVKSLISDRVPHSAPT